jgi:DNA-binding XRE family transcriptional regulator
VNSQPSVHHTNLRTLALILEQLPELLFQTRQHHKMTQAEVALEVGVSYQTIANFEMGLGVRSQTVLQIVRWLADTEVEYRR